MKLTELEDAFCDVVKYASSLHNHHTRSYLIRLIRLCQLLHRKRSQSMNPHSGHRDVPPTSIIVPERVEAEGLGSSPWVSIEIRSRPHRA